MNDSSGNILIVEDELLAQLACDQLLTNAGYLTYTASSLKEAYHKLRVEHIDLILLDLTLTDGNGLDFLQTIRKQGVQSEVIVISGTGSIDQAMRAASLGVEKYIEKPFELRVLAEFVNHVIQKNKKHNKRIRKGQEYTSCGVARFIKANCAIIVNRKQVAEHFNICESTVSAHVKSITGYSFMNYLYKCRIDEAKKLISQSPLLTLEAIAKQLGFKTREHFSRVFHEYANCPPSFFRKID